MERDTMKDDIGFLEQMQHQQQTQLDTQRLKVLFDEASAQYSEKASQFNAYQTDAASERTSFYDKIAIGAGAAIAAMVSFLGAKPHTLEPRWMLRASLVTLGLTMFTALLRNFLYPY
jgi:hypothetical protein